MCFTSIYPSLYSKIARCKVDSLGSAIETSKDDHYDKQNRRRCNHLNSNAAARR